MDRREVAAARAAAQKPYGAEGAGADGRGGGRPRGRRRVRSVRRGPVVLPALMGLIGCAALLAPRFTASFGGQPPSWPDWLSGVPAAVHTTDWWVIGGASALALAGVAMVVLALTPGARRELAGEPLLPGVRTSLDRRGVGALLRDTALRVPGISGARVRVRGRRAVVRAVLAFGDPTEALDALTAELAARRDRLGLVRPPRLVIRIAPVGYRPRIP
ncbi:DUF6286 domain-containing protein [Streptomyces pinistramenti]|uniref:DUF6286 domain-containing protein n=1 Tax=Streptomyces pinistramenti TaxID=2884812 RepID=UPI001D07DB8C|nr:DUF6286 domain-containing protein [Streptomyces pinistramenti]MCB5905947.1 DUF6286 domain-containing protein [Streptomyces pinistramenti]